MLNRFISKAYTNEARESDDAANEPFDTATLNTTQVVGNAVPSTLLKEDSPHPSEDDYDVPVLVDRRPSASSFPRVHVVDGSLTYDNVPTSPVATTAKETNDLVRMDVKSANRGGEEITVSRNQEQARKNNTAGEIVAVSDDATSLPLISQGPNLAEIEGPKEAKDDLLLSLHVSELDLSDIKDMVLNIPSDVERSNKDIIMNKVSKMAEDDTDGNGNQSNSSLKSTTIADASNENPETKKLLPAAAVELNKRLLLRFVSQRVLLSFAILFVATLLIARMLGGNNPSMLPFSSPSSSSSSNTDTAQPLRFGDATKEPATGAAASLTAQSKSLKDSGATNDAQATLFVASSNWNASGIVDQSVTDDGIMKLTSIDIELPKTKADAAREIHIDKDRDFRVFPKLHADGITSCGGSQWDFGMSTSKLGVLALLLVIATSMLGSRNETIPSNPKAEQEKGEDDEAKKSIQYYDLSKYHNNHTVAHLRGLLRIRKCRTMGKKSALVLRLASVYKAELDTLTVVQLRKILKSRNFTQYGTKAEIIRALVEDCPY